MKIRQEVKKMKKMKKLFGRLLRFLANSTEKPVEEVVQLAANGGRRASLRVLTRTLENLPEIGGTTRQSKQIRTLHFLKRKGLIKGRCSKNPALVVLA